MKKLIMCAAAAIVALASCSKTQVISTEDPKEINFKAVTGVMTKAETTDQTLANNNMGVFAYVNGTETATEAAELYFSNQSFELKNGQQTWSGTTAMYWPIAHSLDFVVYHPYQALVNGYPSFSQLDKILSINASDAAVDYLYGALYYNNKNATTATAPGYNKANTTVPVDLKHAKAKVTVNMTYSNVAITNLKLDNQVMTGTYTVDYDASNGPDVDWEPASQGSAVTIIQNNGAGTDLNQSGGSASGYVLVVPETFSSISFDYKISGSDATLHYVITRTANDAWVSGKNYIFNVTVTPLEIKFTPSVIDWNDDTNVETL